KDDDDPLCKLIEGQNASEDRSGIQRNDDVGFIALSATRHIHSQTAIPCGLFYPGIRIAGRTHAPVKFTRLAAWLDRDAGQYTRP
ncbi:MAG: hypothetical protein AAFR90_15450, partial [Pseudomonadota bacterium]